MIEPVFAQASVEACFDYLADPRNRPAWQSSLRGVELREPDEAPRPGTRWSDVTVVGIRPELTITRMERPRLWEERGTWRGMEAWLTLRFESTPRGTRIDTEVRISGTGPARLVVPVVRRLAPAAIAADLRRAAQLVR